MKQPRISIIVPTYNRPGLLERALNSIAQQKYKNYETIVVNDGGEDVAQIVDGFHRTRYINKPINQGLAAARNSGLRVANGDWIAYLDDDDLYYEWHLSTLAAYTGKARVIYTDADVMWPTREKRRLMSIDFDSGYIMSRNITPVCCVLHDRWLIPEVGMFDETLPNHEDWDLWIRMSKVCDFLHVAETTCCIDRTRPTMSSDTEIMQRGMLFVKRRYRDNVYA